MDICVYIYICLKDTGDGAIHPNCCCDLISMSYHLCYLLFELFINDRMMDKRQASGVDKTFSILNTFGGRGVS